MLLWSYSTVDVVDGWMASPVRVGCQFQSQAPIRRSNQSSADIEDDEEEGPTQQPTRDKERRDYD